jgi:hypothetical protein
MSARMFAGVAVLGIAVFVGGGRATAQNQSGPPWAVAASAAGITLRWYPDDVGQAQAHAVANAHCAWTGRSAALAALEQDGSAEIGTYSCR